MARKRRTKKMWDPKDKRMETAREMKAEGERVPKHRRRLG